MKKSGLLTLFLGVFFLFSIAQNSSLNGPTVNMDRNASLWVLDESDDQIVFATLQPGIPRGYEDFLIHRYDKRTHSIEIQKLDDDLDCRFAYLYDDQVIAVKQGIDSKTKSVDYLKAPVPASVSDKAIKKLPFTSLYQVPLEGNNYSFSSMTFSPDRSKFAILTILKPKSSKRIAHVADVAVFENNGELLWHQRQNAHWLINDKVNYYLSNEGAVYIAEYGSYYNAYLHQTDSLHISVYNNGDIWNYTEGFGTNAVFGCGKALLKDGRFVVCGVPCQNNRNSRQLITYFVSPDGDVEKEESSFEIPFNDGYRYEYAELNSGPEKYLPYFFDIKELDDGLTIHIEDDDRRNREQEKEREAGAHDRLNILFLFQHFREQRQQDDREKVGDHCQHVQKAERGSIDARLFGAHTGGKHPLQHHRVHAVIAGHQQRHERIREALFQNHNEKSRIRSMRRI